MTGTQRRDHLYAEALEGVKATRMIVEGPHKLIWYPAGNVIQLFDLARDPRELEDRSSDPAYRLVRERLEERLAAELYGEDEAYLRNGSLVGCAAPEVAPAPNRGLSGQRGLHYPQPPVTDPARVVGTP
jgi:hypothetical protein